MGPITLFDKSFLQSLSVDESVWFDQYFLPIVAPLFYVETLADLDKPPDDSHTPEHEVRVIADKFPYMCGKPCAFHADLALLNLAGSAIPMNSIVPLPGGRPVKMGARTGIVWDESPEYKAFYRWQEEKFMDVEREFARYWRHSLSTLPLDAIGKVMSSIGIAGESSRDLAEARAVADIALRDPLKSQPLLELALLFLGASIQQRALIMSRWQGAGSPPLLSYAPYASFVLMVEIFFQVALSAGVISRLRPSNRMDIAYLYYLPFCMVFTTSDRLQARCAHLFLRDDQDFVWGEDLKADLRKINEYFLKLPDKIKDNGVMTFAKTPPQDMASNVTQLWDRHMRSWRNQQERPDSITSHTHANVVEKLRMLQESVETPLEQYAIDAGNPDIIAFKRKIKKRKGSWWQVPKDIG